MKIRLGRAPRRPLPTNTRMYGDECVQLHLFREQNYQLIISNNKNCLTYLLNKNKIIYCFLCIEPDTPPDTMYFIKSVLLPSKATKHLASTTKTLPEKL
ncbi:MAG: hypothetical protein ACI83W_001049 [Marinoscillum sp.]|jgi:hypothetical protein